MTRPQPGPAVAKAAPARPADPTLDDLASTVVRRALEGDDLNLAVSVLPYVLARVAPVPATATKAAAKPTAAILRVTRSDDGEVTLDEDDDLGPADARRPTGEPAPDPPETT